MLQSKNLNYQKKTSQILQPKDLMFKNYKIRTNKNSKNKKTAIKSLKSCFKIHKFLNPTIKNSNIQQSKNYKLSKTLKSIENYTQNF